MVDMTDPRAKYISPSASETAFNCPHCGAFANQSWYSVHADAARYGQIPVLIAADDVEKIDLSKLRADQAAEILERRRKAATGRPFLHPASVSRDYDVGNIHIAKCFNCEEITIWIYGKLAYPLVGGAPFPNPDLSADVSRDYNEAGSILDLSPRGAAALLRLAIQKLCKELGGSGENINKDIAALVEKGLDVRVQQALDIVRVIGNNAVHPGQIDLKDDRFTAEKLFVLVNLIADIMISQPRHVQSMFDGLPEGARKAIEKRDSKN